MRVFKIFVWLLIILFAYLPQKMDNFKISLLIIYFEIVFLKNDLVKNRGL